MTTETEEPNELEQLKRAAAGDQNQWSRVVMRYRERLRRLAAFRLDPRLQGRVDPSDVVQEACLDAAKRLPEFLAKPAVPFFLWLRFLTRQQLATLHRHHLGRECRAVHREAAAPNDGMSDDSMPILVARLVGSAPGPSTVAIQAERAVALHAALEQMDDIDREILALRHFEELSNAEAALVLGLSTAAASKRYIRALRRLREILEEVMDRSTLLGGAP
jgi:RNA polymerase sigma-70 factor (ECF subfamily)